ncbi:hypothetical protein [Rhizobium freirei]|uniref:hypothetical protein n=1 Tax=Rhizobium freirei TaxID=1353277 RepID=UPI001F0AB96F|nr:hypothetical protein [Rhizobium freirei]
MAGIDVCAPAPGYEHSALTLNIALGVKINVGYFAATDRRSQRIISPETEVSEEGAARCADDLSGVATHAKMAGCTMHPQSRKACANRSAA